MQDANRAYSSVHNCEHVKLCHENHGSITASGRQFHHIGEFAILTRQPAPLRLLLAARLAKLQKTGAALTFLEFQHPNKLGKSQHRGLFPMCIIPRPHQ